MIIIILLALVIIAIVVFKRKSGPPKSVSFYLFFGGMIGGCGGLLLGILGAIILAPESNIAPIIGFLFTGPIGFILGILSGWWFWKRKIKIY
jgi:hypothetical protein